jgi:hypothetical protein
MRLQEGQLLSDGGVAVVIAIGGVAEEGHATLLIDGHADAGVDDLGVGGSVAEGDVGRRILGVGPQEIQGRIGTRLRAGVVAVEDKVRGVVVQALEADVKDLGNVQGDVGEDGVAFVVKGIEGTAEAVVVEFCRREVPEEVGTGT